MPVAHERALMRPERQERSQAQSSSEYLHNYGAAPQSPNGDLSALLAGLPGRHEGGLDVEIDSVA